METTKNYFPCLTIREAECRALTQLAEPTKDLMFPIIKLQAWPRSKVGESGPVQRALSSLSDAFGTRFVALDLAPPRNDLESAWAVLGYSEISQLHQSANGFANWCEIFESKPNLIPVVQWSDDPNTMLDQVQRLRQLGRGIVFRFKRSQAWNLNQASVLSSIDFYGTNVLLVFDCEQINRNEDLTAIGTLAQNTILSINNLVPNAQKTFVLSGSSFPASFADIHPSFADLPLRERQLFDLLRPSGPLLQAAIDLKYGDHASVFASERPPAFRGAPRVDYPKSDGWIYHRSDDGFLTAALRVRNDPQWDESLLCWGSQRIRTAATGDITGLGSQSPWVAIRINIHLHRQAHAGAGPTTPVEEDWVD